MEMKDFAEKVCNAMKLILGGGYEVRLQEVQKNNGVKLLGLLILTENQNVSPTIYLKPFWEAYEDGVPFAELVRRILQIYREDTPEESVDMSFFREFARVRDRICYRLIHAEQNRELLEKIPHVPFLDLAICFYYAYEGEELGIGTITIYNTHLNLWKTSVTELMRLAQSNTPRLFHWECSPMTEVVRELMKHQEEAQKKRLLAETELHFFADVPMQILSNEQRVYGAACILYPEMLEQIAGAADANLYILPSSVHEVILLPDRGQEDVQELKSMICEVNCTQLEPEEVLSDNLYYFDCLEKNVRII